MKPSSIIENVEFIVNNIVNDMVNWVEENVNNNTPPPVDKKGKRQRVANRREKHTDRFKATNW